MAARFTALLHSNTHISPHKTVAALSRLLATACWVKSRAQRVFISISGLLHAFTIDSSAVAWSLASRTPSVSGQYIQLHYIRNEIQYTRAENPKSHIYCCILFSYSCTHCLLLCATSLFVFHHFIFATCVMRVRLCLGVCVYACCWCPKISVSVYEFCFAQL